MLDTFLSLSLLFVLIAVARVAWIVMQKRDPDADTADLLRRRQSEAVEASHYRNKVLHDRAIWKMVRTVEICRDHLNPARLAPGQDRYIHYYLGYLTGFAEAVCRADGVEFDRALHLPIALEASKLLGEDGRGQIDEGTELLARLDGDGIYRQGQEDGRLDGAEASADSGERYFQRIDRFFHG
ncbi:MAG: hypothetical protein RJQ21_05585 [Rhodospirillales bacterium]